MISTLAGSILVSIVTWVSTTGRLYCLHTVHLCLSVLVLVSEAVVLLERIQTFSLSISRSVSGQPHRTGKFSVQVVCTKDKFNDIMQKNNW